MIAPVTATTNGVSVEVMTSYDPRYSHKGGERRWVFLYRVRIINKSDHTVQLLRRHWEICDSIYGKEVVHGDGVVGQQPVLEPGQSYSYTSACPLISPLGSMKGYYEMEKHISGAIIKVEIPEFTLMAPELMN